MSTAANGRPLKRSGGGGEPSLFSKVKEYIIATRAAGRKTTTIDSIVDHLRKTFPAFQRKQIAALRSSVQRAFDIIVQDESIAAQTAPVGTKSAQANDHISIDESDGDDDDGEDSSDAFEMSNVDGLDETPKTNLLNGSMRATYKLTAASNQSLQQGPGEMSSETSSPKRTVVSAKSSASRGKSEAGLAPPSRKRKRLAGPKDDSSIEGAITNKLNSSDSSRPKARPTVRFADLGGIEDILQDVRELIERPITHPEIYTWLGVEPPRGILLHGPPGCGKTALATAIAGELDVPFFQIAAPEVVSGMSGESEAKIRTLFQDAAANAPAIIFIDEIDAITPKRETAAREMERRIVAQLLTCMDSISMDKTDGSPVLVIGATNRPDAIDPALRRAGRFDREIALNVPDENARARILMVLSTKLRVDGNFDFEKIAKDTPGFVGADLAALTKEAAAIAVNRIFLSLEHSHLRAAPAEPDAMDTDPPVAASAAVPPEVSPFHQQTTQFKQAAKMQEIQKRNAVSDALRSRGKPFTEQEMAPLSISMADFELAIKRVQPSSKREGFATIPKVTWEDVGALSGIRRELHMAVLEPIRSRHKYEAMGMHSPAGILLYGPPGCGKTLLAKAVANEAQASFISIKGPELLNKYVGESERAVRVVFQRARASAPCIIFFDELDALAPRRSNSENAVGERVVNQLLIELDGLDERRDVFVIAATNRPDMIDPAMLRPGRLDKLLYVPLPTREERVQILVTCVRKTPMAADIDIPKLAMDPKCDGYSGADLASLVREASVEALQESIELNDPNVPSVALRHFHKAMLKVVPSVSKRDELRYNALKKKLFSPRLRVDDDGNPVAEEPQNPAPVVSV